ncbi:MAG: protein-L-isoaspartate(D-aspartate) O-methyltransferase [Gammaproteobacteria bacterium]|nr:protein-L-isoaspartate(D-aspartate) O-methyltransferase [Gammaproteobacteria bacterium]MBT8110342.1 protein-L-isoaspartate(D-aspartate) O-methyltransferase [Gammaproteobacteria bacterium]NND47689.1 protein-L-isoaspartate(D-aspartate) O-methyltransferase [Woeseiaceae bacterium]NNL45045.1 protein-L-isoaspartate(D-aspartate) O-methyltransferase [Woeseiaceae bacterium]
MSDYSRLRERMVKRQIAGRGVRSGLVLDAMRKVPRERFLPRGQRVFAYDDSPLPIGDGQTISQPYIVAYMAESLALEGGEKVLEIGTGSGYAAAVLAEIAAEVYTIERIEGLATLASTALEDLGYTNVHVRCGDGTLGWPEEAPYDGIVVSAGGPDVPDTLKHQLKTGGRLVIPVGRSKAWQELIRVTRVAEEDFQTEDLVPVRFVPLVGEEGWSQEF